MIEVALPIAVKVVVLSMNLSGTYIDEDVQMLYKVDAKNWVMNLCDEKDEWELASWTEIQCKKSLALCWDNSIVGYSQTGTFGVS